MSCLVKCNEQMCKNKEAEFSCICGNFEYYFCFNHYISHLKQCSEADHKTIQIMSVNSKICEKIEDKVNVVIEEIIRIKELVIKEINKVEDYHKNAWAKASKTKKNIITELQANLDTCNVLIEKIKKPILKKDYYTQLEYLLINKDPSYSDSIIDQINPPIIQEIERDKNMWKKISFQSADFSHLLSAYNTYCFTIRKNNIIAYSNCIGDEKEFRNDNINESSRCMLISPNEILITGSLESPTMCSIFDIEKLTIREQNKLNHQRFWHCCIFLKGFPTVIGGRFDSENLKTVESFKYGHWEDAPSLNYPRSSLAVSSLFGKVYACGGNKDHFFEVFDEEKNKWEEIMISKPPDAYISPGLIALSKDVILIFGGSASKECPSNEATKFYLKNNESAGIINLCKAGKFSWGSYIKKDDVFMSAVYFEQLNEFIEWRLIEEIIFSEQQ